MKNRIDKLINRVSSNHNEGVDDIIQFVSSHVIEENDLSYFLDKIVESESILSSSEFYDILRCIGNFQIITSPELAKKLCSIGKNYTCFNDINKLILNRSVVFEDGDIIEEVVLYSRWFNSYDLVYDFNGPHRKINEGVIFRSVYLVPKEEAVGSVIISPTKFALKRVEKYRDGKKCKIWNYEKTIRKEFLKRGN